MNNIELTNEEMERIRDAFKNVPFAHLIGLKLGKVERGSATLYLEARDELKQTRGLVHGGAIGSLIDTAAAVAILTLLEPHETTATVDLTIHYLRPLTQGRATAKAHVRRAGRRLIVVAADVFDEATTLIATALTSYVRLS